MHEKQMGEKNHKVSAMIHKKTGMKGMLTTAYNEMSMLYYCPCWNGNIPL